MAPTLTPQVQDLLSRSFAQPQGAIHGAKALNAEGLGLHQLVEAQAAQTPDAIALVHEKQTFTYRQINERSNQLAHYLIKLGVQTEQLIAISLVRSPDMLIAFLGILKAGAAYVPIDPNYPEARRQYILTDAQVEITLTHSDLADALFTERGQTICLDRAASVLAQQPKSNPDLKVSPKQLAYIIYTSGSTGNPKGVMAHHLGLVNYSLALAEALELTAADRMLQFSTMSFDFIVSEVYPTLATGGALVLRSDDMVTSTKAFVDFVAENKVSVIQFTTAFWHELVSGIDRLGISLPPSLRLVLFGGEKASLALCRQWVEKVGDYPRLFNAYGPTEATVITTLYDAVAEGYDGSQDLPIGRAIRNAQTYVLDEKLNPVGPDESGELYIGGPGVTNGYLNLPEKTANVFIGSPFQTGDRLYKTGDLVKMDESGLIEFVGRADFQVKIRGFRIELGEIESCLDRYEAIEHRIVIAREDTPGDKRLVAYVVTKGGHTLDITALKEHLKAELPSFMMPAAIVVMPELPKNANGKIDRKALPVPVQEDAQRSLVSARSPLEEKLVTLWKSVLNLDTVGVTDDFFDLGGNSLLVMRLFSELEALFDQRLPLVEIFAAPTIEKMAERLEQITVVETTATDESKAEASTFSHCDSLVPLRIGTVYPPLFLVHDVDGDTALYLHLARRLERDRTVYAIRPQRLWQRMDCSDDAPLAHSRVVEFAQHCVEQMRLVQPVGPYLIGGLCAGGVIAFETARQLEAAEENVVLTLMDAPAPNAQKRAGLIADQRLENLGNVWSTNKNPLQVAIKIWQKGTNALRYEISSTYNKVQSCARAHTFQWFQDKALPIPSILQSLSARSLILFAYHTYHIEKPFKGKVLLVRATAGNGTKEDAAYVSEYEDSMFGWSPYVQQPIEVTDVPGGHSTMLGSDKAQFISKALEIFIKKSLR